MADTETKAFTKVHCVSHSQKNFFWQLPEKLKTVWL